MRQRTISCKDISSATAKRFWAHVDMLATPEGCWPWIGAKFRKGYGNFHIRSIGNIGAHIVSYILTAREDKLEPLDCVLHDCDNPPCCRPAHVFKGSKKDNTQDMIQKGRSKNNIGFTRGHAPKGELAGRAKLTNEQVREIKRLRATGVGQKIIAKQFGVRYQSIQAIDHGRSWKHL